MRFLRFTPLLALLLALTSGCAVNLPFNNRVGYPTIQEAKSEPCEKSSPVAIRWVPADFPERVDIQGASGFVGGGSRTRIPTGPALSNRITEILDTMIGVNPSADDILEISVQTAQTEFEYSAFTITPTLDVGLCVFTAKFSFKDLVWQNVFSAEKKDPDVGSSQTGVLESVWDEIALAVGKDVAEHIRQK